VARTGAAVTLALVLLQTAVHAVNRVWALSGRLDVNNEMTVFSLLSGCVLVLSALACLLVLGRARPAPRGLAYVAAVLLFFAVDEVLALHERVGVEAARLLGLSSDWTASCGRRSTCPSR